MIFKWRKFELLTVSSSYFTSDLTKKELKLVEKEDKNHVNTYSEYYFGHNPDVDNEKMKRSDLKSKYVHGQCLRWPHAEIFKFCQIKTVNEL